MHPVINVASLISVAAAGYLASEALRGLHVRLLGMTFGPVDTIFSGAGALVLLAGLYAIIGLRGVRLEGEPGGGTPPAPTERDAPTTG